MSTIKVGNKVINLSKRVTTRKNVGDIINELNVNVERLLYQGRKNGENPFPSKKKLKAWIVSNQEGCDKYIPEVYYYFVHKCNL